MITLPVIEEPVRSMTALPHPPLYVGVEPSWLTDEPPISTGTPRSWLWGTTIFHPAKVGEPVDWEWNVPKEGDMGARGGPTDWDWSPIGIVAKIHFIPAKLESVVVQEWPLTEKHTTEPVREFDSLFKEPSYEGPTSEPSYEHAASFEQPD